LRGVESSGIASNSEKEAAVQEEAVVLLSPRMAGSAWQEMLDENGSVYYYNSTTESYRWTKPTDMFAMDPLLFQQEPHRSDTRKDSTKPSPKAAQFTRESAGQSMYGYFYNAEGDCWHCKRRTRPADPTDIWTVQESYDGKGNPTDIYYYNEITGEASWDEPSRSNGHVSAKQSSPECGNVAHLISSDSGYSGEDEQ
jgi:hypothetical protein